MSSTNNPGSTLRDAARELLKKVQAGKSITARIRTALHGCLRFFEKANSTGAPNAAVTTYLGSQTSLIDSYGEAIIDGLPTTIKKGTDLLSRVGQGPTMEERLQTMFAGWIAGVHAANAIGEPNATVSEGAEALSDMIGEYSSAIVEGMPIAQTA